MWKFVLGISVFCTANAFCAPTLLLTYAYGYTHYSPDDLNEVNRAFEASSEAAGFKGYTVEKFDGHPEYAVGLGVAWSLIQLMLEVEIWEEKFSQRGVTFDQGEIQGSLDADESFLFAPLVLKFSYPWQRGKLLLLPGYGLGVMLGAASVRIKTTYSGENAIADDEINLKITSGFNMVHRFDVDIFYRITSWAAFGLTTGFRVSNMKFFRVSSTQGSSFIFDLLFSGGAQEDDKLYLDETIANNEFLQFLQTEEVRRQHRQIQGNLTGPYLWAKLLFNWGG